MNDTIIKNEPSIIEKIDADAAEISFGQPSDDLTGVFLRTIIAGKPSGSFLELGTGAGRATAWLLGGMGQEAKLISVEADEALIGIARKHLGLTICYLNPIGPKAMPIKWQILFKRWKTTTVFKW